MRKYRNYGKIEMKMMKSGVEELCDEKTLNFTIFLIHRLAENWEKLPSEVYRILNTTRIMDEYIIPCYDTLHSLGAEYLVEDITEYVKEKEVDL